jgi:hypothetical protein
MKYEETAKTCSTILQENSFYLFLGLKHPLRILANENSLYRQTHHIKLDRGFGGWKSHEKKLGL